MDVEFFNLARLCTFTQSTELLFNSRDHSGTDHSAVVEGFPFSRLMEMEEDPFSENRYCGKVSMLA